MYIGHQSPAVIFDCLIKYAILQIIQVPKHEVTSHVITVNISETGQTQNINSSYLYRKYVANFFSHFKVRKYQSIYTQVTQVNTQELYCQSLLAIRKVVIKSST